VDRVDERFDVVERRPRHQAVSEVEDVAGPATCPLQDLPRTAADELSRPEEDRWIQVALHAEAESNA
jgi:hypothetical protein